MTEAAIKKNHIGRRQHAINVICHSDGLHNGYYCLYAKKGPQYAPYLVKYDTAPNMINAFKSVHLCRYDYYITKNALSSTTHRDGDHVFTLTNIVVDIDWHDCDDSHKLQNEINRINGILTTVIDYNDEGLPMPNLIVKSGRGLQIWWSIMPISYKLKALYIATENHIFELLTSILTDYRCKLHIDHAASKNVAGIYRYPGSYNTSTGTWGTYELLHTDYLDVINYVNANALHTNTSQRIPIVRADIDTDIYIASDRERALFQLVQLRQGNGKVIERDLFLFSLYCIWSKCITTHDEIMDHLYKLNRTFNKPMSPTEIQRYMSTASRKRYKLTNAKMIDILSISPEEQSVIGIYTSQRSQDRALRRKRKEERNQQVLKYASQGKSTREIAQLLGCSHQTVSRVIKTHTNKSN